MAKPPFFSVSWVQNELTAKSYLKSRVSSLPLSADEKETAVFRAAIYSLIDDGLETKHSSFDGFTFSSRSVDLIKFATTLNSRCEQVGGTHVAQGFQMFRANPSLVLDRLQRLNLVELTEDLVNDSSSITLKIDSLLPSAEGTTPAAPKEDFKQEEEDYETADEDWEDDSATAMSEDGEDSDYIEEEEDTRDIPPVTTINTNDTPAQIVLPAIHFTLPDVTLKTAAGVKNTVRAAIRKRLKGCGHKRIVTEAVVALFELGFGYQPVENTSSNSTEIKSDVVFTQRPVVLNSIFKRVAAKFLPEKGSERWNKLRWKQQERVQKKRNSSNSLTEFNSFRNLLWSLKPRHNIIMNSSKKFPHLGGKMKKCMVDIKKLLPNLKLVSDPYVAPGAAAPEGHAANGGAGAPPAPAPAAREKQLLESPRVKRMALDTSKLTINNKNSNAAINTGTQLGQAQALRLPAAATTTRAPAVPVRLICLHPPSTTNTTNTATTNNNNMNIDPAALAAVAAAVAASPNQLNPPPAQPLPDATRWNKLIIINTLRAANQAMFEIKQLKGCLGLIGTPSDVRSPLSSRIDLLSIAGSTGVVWMFDFKSTSQPESREIWKLLKANIFEIQTAAPSHGVNGVNDNGSEGALQQHRNQQGVFVVVHDARWLGPALYRQGGILLNQVFDVQVAHGVLQVMKGIGGHGGIALPRSLENIFTEYKVPSNPKLNLGLQSQPKNFQCRPLLQTVKEFIAHDTFHLGLLGNVLRLELGSEGITSVVRMSKAYSEIHFIENQKSYKKSNNNGASFSSSAAALASNGAGASEPTFDQKKLPHGVPLHINFDETRHYAANYVIAPLDMTNITGGEKISQQEGRIEGAAAAAGGDLGLVQGNTGTDINGNFTITNGTNPNGTTTATNTGGANGNTASHINNIDPSQNKDVATILSLFPPEISDAVLSLCNTSYKPNQHGMEEEDEGEEEEEGEYNMRIAVITATTAAAPPPTAPTLKWPIEILVDVGRPVSVRFSDGTETLLDDSLHFSVEDALKMMVNARKRLGLGNGGGVSSGFTAAVADSVAAAATNGIAAEENPYGDRVHISDIFSSDNRAGIPGTLHRISAIRGRKHEVLGLTYRIGRHLEGIGDLVHDVLARVSRGTGNISATASNGFNTTHFSLEDALPTTAASTTPSLLLLGPPGVGKSTLLRDVARIVADTFSKRVVVVDTSNEIAGEGSIPHACIGKARRMMVPCRDRQHEVMKEAVQNHNPDVVIIDEIADHYEVAAAKTIAQRGVALIGTAHGTSLETLLKNPELNPLVGGIQAVILGDQAVRQSHSTKKTQLERKGAPCFTTLIELLAPSKWRIHRDVAKSVDCLLNGKKPETELRWIAPDGRYMAQFEGGVPHAMDVGGLKAAQLTMKALTAQAAGVDGGERVAWVADLALLASRYD